LYLGDLTRCGIDHDSRAAEVVGDDPVGKRAEIAAVCAIHVSGSAEYEVLVG
jgi:hypothetical protein